MTGRDRSTKREYRKRKRAADEQRTRARIVDAAEQLHGTLGPARTTISAVAEKAGVTRATVYRHFPDDEALFLACSGQWLSRQPLPAPDTWGHEADPLARLRLGLTEIYRYYRAGEQMITGVLRDAAVVPEAVRSQRLAQERLWFETLLRPFPERRRRTVRASVAHAMAFPTWRSLCVGQGLSDRAAVGLVVGMVSAARRSDGRT